MTFKTQISSSRFLINLLCVREMRNKKEFEAVEDIMRLELEKEGTWSKVMKILLKVFEKHQMNHSKTALEAEDELSEEFETAVIVR